MTPNPMAGWLTVREVADRLGYHPKAIYRALASRGVTPVTIGGVRWVREAEVAGLAKRTPGRPKLGSHEDQR